MVQNIFVFFAILQQFYSQIKELKSTMYQAVDNNDLICHLLTRHMVWINNFYYIFLPLLGKSIKSKFSVSTQFWNGIMVKITKD